MWLYGFVHLQSNSLLFLGKSVKKKRLKSPPTLCVHSGSKMLHRWNDAANKPRALKGWNPPVVQQPAGAQVEHLTRLNRTICARLSSLFKSVTQRKRNYPVEMLRVHTSLCVKLQSWPRPLWRLANCFAQHDAHGIISECQGEDAEPQHHVGLLVHRPTVWKQYYHNWLNKKTHSSVVHHCGSKGKQAAPVPSVM